MQPDLVNEKTSRFQKDLENIKDMIEKGNLPWIITTIAHRVDKIDKMLQKLEK